MVTITRRADRLIAINWIPGPFITLTEPQWQDLRSAVRKEEQQ